jgi:large subunit ribosomal protein L15
MKLCELRPPKGARKKRKIVGRGPGSGHGKTSCKGHKGQKARSGGKIPVWFEGGQMPLQRRLPKRGFHNIFKKEYALVKLDDLKNFEDGTTVTPELLVEKKIVNKIKDGIKILGDGEINRSLTIKGAKLSHTAREKIEKAGGKVLLQNEG